jgi:hypothetical protein
MRRRILAGAALAAALVVTSAAPALAGHDHYIVTPNGRCHQVAAGQTSITDKTHGGYHQFHVHVHTGAAATDNRTLGHGHAAVEVYKGADAPSICFS